MVPTDLYAFGSKQMPPGARPVQDFGVTSVTDLVGPDSPPLPKGASTFADIGQSILGGHYHRLPSGTPLPEGIGVIADGSDVLPGSPRRPTHHTIYPTRIMTVEEFNRKLWSLPWQWQGKR
jgi:hypothetical protein